MVEPGAKAGGLGAVDGLTLEALGEFCAGVVTRPEFLPVCWGARVTCTGSSLTSLGVAICGVTAIAPITATDVKLTAINGNAQRTWLVNNTSPSLLMMSPVVVARRVSA